MGLRFRKRLKLFPGFSLNFSAKGLSSLSLGGAPFTINIPLAREGGTRTTASLPGTGLHHVSEESRPVDEDHEFPEIQVGSRGGHYYLRRSRSGNIYKQYI